MVGGVTYFKVTLDPGKKKDSIGVFGATVYLFAIDIFYKNCYSYSPIF